MDNKTLIRENEIEDDLVSKIYHTEDKIILEICYNSGKFMIIKNYPKNPSGEKSCEDFLDKIKRRK